MIWSWTLKARRKITLLLAESSLLEAISGSDFLIEVCVGTGPWSDPIRVISFKDLFIDVDMQSILFGPTENIIGYVVVLLSCQRPAGYGIRIRLELVIILRSWPFSLLSR